MSGTVDASKRHFRPSGTVIEDGRIFVHAHLRIDPTVYEYVRALAKRTRRPYAQVFGELVERQVAVELTAPSTSEDAHGDAHDDARETSSTTRAREGDSTDVEPGKSVGAFDSLDCAFCCVRGGERLSSGALATCPLHGE